MKVAVGIIARPVESLLVLCLRPVIAHFDGLVILTAPNPKWKEGIASLVHAPRRFSLFDYYKWTDDYGGARNTLIRHVEKLGYDWLMMLDADESMLPDDLIIMRKYMETEESLIFPRYEFVDDFNHYVPKFYPDWQARAFKLNMGYYYQNRLHEQLCKQGKPLMPFENSTSTKIPEAHIFHYGKSKPTEETWLKYNTYERIAAGQAPLTSVPVDAVIPQSWALENKKVRFLGNKPL